MKLNDLNLCIVDIETTGARHHGHRIIEIGALKIKKGKLVDTFHTLLNPQRPIPPSITILTGITNEDVVRAPEFGDVHRKLLDFFGDHIFVAHNATFDYGFIRQEFDYLDIEFKMKMFCSVRLSRELFKEERRHDLSSIIERFQITIENRHRALDDAKAVWKFFEAIQEKVDPQSQTKALTKVIKTPSLPKHLKIDIDGVVHTPGVYVFYNDQDIPLYVGRANDLRLRILNHLTEEKRFQEEVKRVETIGTQGELAARLIESQLIKKYQPVYNRRIVEAQELTVLKIVQTTNRYNTFKSEAHRSLNKEEVKEAVFIFRAEKDLKRFLENMFKKHKLCRFFGGLEKGR